MHTWFCSLALPLLCHVTFSSAAVLLLVTPGDLSCAEAARGLGGSRCFHLDEFPPRAVGRRPGTVHSRAAGALGAGVTGSLLSAWSHLECSAEPRPGVDSGIYTTSAQKPSYPMW